MIIDLVVVPNTVHGPQNDAYKGRMPKRARFMAPDAWRSMSQLLQTTSNHLIFTDMYRSAESSLAAASSKRGVQRPAYSAHNYGLAVDLDVEPTLAALGVKYAELLEIMMDHYWFCHRRDADPSALESWHFNYLGEQPGRYIGSAIANDRATWSLPVEARLQDLFGRDFEYSDTILQRYLAKLGLYSGGLDGKIGPLSREAIAAFQRAWNIVEPGAGRITRRTLAFVAAEKRIVEGMT